MNYVPRLASNLDTPNLILPASKDYRHELCLGSEGKKVKRIFSIIFLQPCVPDIILVPKIDVFSQDLNSD
jgi:hypothetical protein